MADTKQAMPEQCPKCGGPKDVRWCINQDGLSVQHSLYRAECVPCDSDWHSIEQSAEYWKSRAATAELKVLTFHEEIVKLRSGPDRATQDAPDDYLDAADARFKAEYAPKTDYKWDYDSYIAGWDDALEYIVSAKAAR